MSTPDQIDALVSGEIDVGFIRYRGADSRLQMRPVLDERLVAALGPHTRWSRRAGLRSVAAEPFIIISRDRSASFYDHVLGVCAAAGFAPRIVQEASELFTVVSLVRAGLGVALVPRVDGPDASSRRPLSRAGHSRSRLEYRARVAW